MKFQISNFKFQIFLILFLLFTVHCSLVTAAEWSGVDESVIEKYAKEHGREAMTPLINTDQGDILLFVFLVAGVIGGFLGGYYWRILIVEKAPKTKREGQKITG